MYCLCGAMCVYFLYRHSFWWTAATKMKLPSVSIRCHILLLGGVLGWSPNVPPHATLGHLTGLEGVRVRITNIHLSLSISRIFSFFVSLLAPFFFAALLACTCAQRCDCWLADWWCWMSVYLLTVCWWLNDKNTDFRTDGRPMLKSINFMEIVEILIWQSDKMMLKSDQEKTSKSYTYLPLLLEWFGSPPV